MDQEKAYKIFQDGTLAIPPPAYYAGGNGKNVSPPQSSDMDKQVVNDVRRTKKLAIVEMILSCLLLILGMISTGLAANVRYGGVEPCVMGTSIWAPVIGIVTAGLGFGALRFGNYSRKCLLVSYFVMCIISAIASGVLVGFTCVCLAGSSWIIGWYRDDYYYGRDTQRGFPEAMIALEALILVAALAHMIASIVSSAFVGRHWCSSKNNADTTILYIPSQGANGNCPMRAMTVPAGAQVVFVPSNAAGDLNPATLAVAP